MSVAIVMPAWNEASGISEFLNEIHESFAGIEHTLIVVDDCSTDQTVAVVSELRDSGLPIIVTSNASNSGHGPTTLTALQLGLDTDADTVIALDGDGQFLGKDILHCYQELLRTEVQIIEGIRTRKNDPLYRKFTTYSTRVLVWTRCRNFPPDANTPLRVYRREILQKIITKIPSHSLVPNLMISTYVRANKIPVGFVVVDFIDRRGDNPKSTTWGRSKSYLPSKRFIKFCGKATKSWVEFNPRS
jgi:glycosyltransferase involved in cell wall biosynthesis